MKTSESIEHLSTALAAAQGALKNPPKNKINPHFKSRYVDLSDGLDAIRECYAKHGLAFVQGTSVMDGIIILNTRIVHKSGQWLESDYPVGGLGRPQAMGSAMTYARRYSLFGLVGVAGEDDDDGNAAQAADATPVKAKAAPKQMEPGMQPKDSEEFFKIAKEAMDGSRTLEELSQWSVKNAKSLEMMIPKHRAELKDLYIIRRDALKGNG